MSQSPEILALTKSPETFSLREANPPRACSPQTGAIVCHAYDLGENPFRRHEFSHQSHQPKLPSNPKYRSVERILKTIEQRQEEKRKAKLAQKEKEMAQALEKTKPKTPEPQLHPLFMSAHQQKVRWQKFVSSLNIHADDKKSDGGDEGTKKVPTSSSPEQKREVKLTTSQYRDLREQFDDQMLRGKFHELLSGDAPMMLGDVVVDSHMIRKLIGADKDASQIQCLDLFKVLFPGITATDLQKHEEQFQNDKIARGVFREVLKVHGGQSAMGLSMGAFLKFAETIDVPPEKAIKMFNRLVEQPEGLLTVTEFAEVMQDWNLGDMYKTKDEV